MRGLKTAVLLMLAVTACRGDTDADEMTVAADTVPTESAEAVQELLSPVRSVALATVEFGDMAAGRAQRDDVRQYARTVATDHRALVTVLDSAAAAGGATLTQAGAAEELANSVRMAHSGVDALQPGEFDLAYVRAQVESHRQLLDRLDQDLIPGASSEGMRTLLTDTRAMVNAHLTRARQLLAAMLGQSADPAPGPAESQPRPQQPVGTPTSPPPSSDVDVRDAQGSASR